MERSSESIEDFDRHDDSRWIVDICPHRDKSLFGGRKIEPVFVIAIDRRQIVDFTRIDEELRRGVARSIVSRIGIVLDRLRTSTEPES